MRSTCYTHLTVIYLITQKIFGEKYKSRTSWLYPVAFSLYGPSILLSTLFPNTLGLRSSLKVREG